ncbi:MAG: DUF2141 domain-containing protein [Phycisphaerales bacterium]|nr:DUF2141 domain-containing protein [Phycisphaerales bacterium]
MAFFTCGVLGGCQHDSRRGGGLTEAGKTVTRPTKLVINLTNVPSEAVLVAAAVFSDKSEYLSEGGARYAGKTEQDGAFNGVATIVVEDVEEGFYAITVLADTDGDARMTVNFLGLPNEYFGFSNNAKGILGPPSFQDALVKVTAPITEIDISFIRPPTRWGSEE